MCIVGMLSIPDSILLKVLVNVSTFIDSAHSSRNLAIMTVVWFEFTSVVNDTVNWYTYLHVSQKSGDCVPAHLLSLYGIQYKRKLYRSRIARNQLIMFYV